MGQTMSIVIGNIIVFYLKLQERIRNMFISEKKEKNYYNSDIILKDDEQQADILSSEEINKIIRKQQLMKKNNSNDVNINEYKIIKNTFEMDDPENISEQITNTNNSSSLEIQDIHKEVINIHIDGKEDDEENDNHIENIEELKASILNHD